MPHDYKAILNRIYEEAFSQGRVEVADEIIAPDAVDHEMQGARGPAVLKEAVAMFRGAFPDLKMTMDDAIVEGNQIAARFTMTGTHKGEFAGVPATGKSVKIGGIDIVRFEGDKAVEHWGYTDQMGLMQQLGVMPPS
jgi:steroid delta-isomerase-like uncharacterized protein